METEPSSYIYGDIFIKSLCHNFIGQSRWISEKRIYKDVPHPHTADMFVVVPSLLL